MIQITDNATEQKIFPLFRLGFRPFFLVGSLFSIVSLLLWGLLLSANIHLNSPIPSAQWHAHEMLFGFAGAIILGFLLTAVQTWTGYPGLKGKKLALLFSLWILARIALFIIPENLFWLTMALELSWMPLAALVLAQAIFHAKQWRNLFFVPLLLIMTLLNALSLIGFKTHDYMLSQHAIWSMLFLVFFIIAMMGGRVIPFFTSKGTSTQKVQSNRYIEYLSLFPLLALALLTWFPEYQAVSAYLALITGIANLCRVLRWRPLITLPVALLWSLHFSYLLLSSGLIFYSLALFMPQFNATGMMHLTAIAGFGGIILAMISRVSLGHTGRPLRPSKWMSIAFVSILLAGVIRAFLPLFYPQFTLMSYWLSISLWVGAFGLFILFYAKMLLQARLDKRPG
ncbi:NnrS family protein [Psychromonas sp. CNPT3]|uniref:NnrS family protein n=1 Tax=Psychromonas sp. CNPT3 TaxID=314282 RepID=UPI00006E5843|nr:NnrS family protein [Psychromonas sp. CNPT3]AGH81968.1 NnrS family protein [Psychromonas sp. CNPT3]